MEIHTTHLSISSDSAWKLVQAAIDHAVAIDVEICACVTDPSGQLVALRRMNKAGPAVTDFAIDKAYTAATLQTSTEALYERAASKPAIAQGLTNREKILVFPRGLPIYYNNKFIEGIGISGVTDIEDIECARAALRTLELIDSH